MNILVTGGAGFVGGYLLKDLIKDTSHSITAVLRKGEKFVGNKKKIKKISSDIKIVSGDVTSQSDMLKVTKNMDVLIHLAASVSSKDKDTNYQVNVVGASNIASACSINKCNRVIFISSFVATLQKEHHYGQTKAQAEVEFKKFSDLKLTILRPSLVYGCGGKGFMKMLATVKKIPGIIPLIGTGNNERQPVYVTDITAAIISCISNKKTIDKAYYLGGPAPVKFKDMILTIAQEAGVNKKIIPIPLWSLNIVASIFEAILPSAPMTKRDIASITSTVHVDISQAKKDLKYAPLTYAQGVKKALSYTM